MLTLYVLITTEENRLVAKTVNSVMPDAFETVGSVKEINGKPKKGWYLILFDTEYLSFDLKKGIDLILKMDIDYDVLWLIKKNPDGKLYQSPRMFKDHIRLKMNSFMPADENLKMERILDGWIYEHA